MQFLVDSPPEDLSVFQEELVHLIGLKAPWFDIKTSRFTPGRLVLYPSRPDAHRCPAGIECINSVHFEQLADGVSLFLLVQGRMRYYVALRLDQAVEKLVEHIWEKGE